METIDMKLSDALDFLDFCSGEGILVLGVERVMSINEKLVPDMECILDLSMRGGCAKISNCEAINNTKRFLMENYGRDRRERFLIVYDDQ